MIVGIGTDIVEIERLMDVILRQGDAFMDRVYAPEEQKAAPAKGKARFAYLAGRWAAKEAVSKALGTGIGAQCAMPEIIIGNLESGQPVVNLTGTARETAMKLGITGWQISISHEQANAIAFVVALNDK